MLHVDHVSRAFGGVFANNDISMRVAPGELRGVIGPNGAGKSTLFSLISGQLHPQSGSISLDGERIDRMPADKRARLGIGVVFQGARLFTQMSVRENVMVGAHSRTKAGVLGALLRSPGQQREERAIRASAEGALERVGLAHRADDDAALLPLGQQRRLQVARALAGEPRLLLLDEPASGLRADERANLSELITQLRSEGMTTLLIEHDVAMVRALSDSITVLDLGVVIADGSPHEVTQDPRVIAAYLGTESADAGRS